MGWTRGSGRSAFRTASGVRIALALLGVVPRFAAAADPGGGDGSSRGGREHGLDDFAVPGLPEGLVRFDVGAGFAPSANAGGSEVAVTNPGVRLRVEGPLARRLSAKAFLAWGTSLYDVQDSADLFDDCPECPTPDEFYSAAFGAQLAYLLNPDRYVFCDGERFALVGENFWRARWERSAFERSIKTGVIAAVGYDLPKRLRLALGAQIDVSLDGGGVSVQPTGMFRLNLAPTLRLQNQGFGLELQWDAHRRLELFATGYRSSDGFRLHDRNGLPSGAEFDDHRWQVGGGFEWKPLRWLHLKTEGGAIVDRRLSVKANGEGTLSDRDVDSSPYVEVRLELRP